MAPLRRFSRGLRRVRNGCYIGAALGIRLGYRALPLPMSLKLRLKHFLFEHMGSTFAATGAYVRWQAAAARRQQPAVAEACCAAIAPSCAQSQLLSLNAAMLPVADGRWEWQGCQGMRARIARALARRRAAATYRPRRMIELGSEDPAHAAARIALPPPGEAPAVSVIVPVFNELASTVECLLSLAANSGDVVFEVIVADDASTDRTQEVLARVANLRLVTQPANVGFLRNCNIAARQARGRRLVLLNNDTQVMRAGSPD
jgi:Glycosyl transferase family 2